jgi:hypothetical protein
VCVCVCVCVRAALSKLITCGALRRIGHSVLCVLYKTEIRGVV